MVNSAYGDQELPRSNVFRWYGREDIEDDPRSGRPTDCRNDNNVEMISQLLLQNCHLSLRMLADEVNIGKDTVRKIVVEDFAKTDLFALCSTLFDTTRQSSSSFWPNEKWLCSTTLCIRLYSPDLAPADYFLFPKLKSHLKGRLFDSFSDIQVAVTRTLNTTAKNDFHKGIQNLYDRANLVYIYKESMSKTKQ